MENVYPLLFGLIGTGVMSLVLYVVAQSGSESVAMVKGVGSSIPTPVGGSEVPGAIVHIVGGLVFAYVYWAIGRAAGTWGAGPLLALGAVVGVARGIVVSAVLGMLAFDQMPMERMAQAGFGVGLVHVIGNVIYGLTISLIFGLSAVDYALRF